MTKKYVIKKEKTSTSKEELKEKQKEKHSILGLFKGYSFNNHSHNRVNYRSIGFNHEPGTV